MSVVCGASARLHIPWLESAVHVEPTWEALERASGDAPFLLDDEDLVEAECWVIADVPLDSVVQGDCNETALQCDERLAAIREVPVADLFRPILELRAAGELRLIDGGHRMMVAKERGQASLSSLVKVVRC